MFPNGVTSFTSRERCLTVGIRRTQKCEMILESGSRATRTRQGPDKVNECLATGFLQVSSGVLV